MGGPVFYPDSCRLAPGEFVNTYEVGEHLGQGRFSDVYLTRKDGRQFALKALRKSYSKKDVKYEKRSLKAMAGCKRVLFLHDSFTHNGHEILVLPILGQSLYDVLQWRYDFRKLGLVEDDLGLPLKLCQKLAVDIIKAVHEMHSRGYLHSDLKPENLMISRKFSDAKELYEARPDSWYVVVGDLGNAFPHDTNEGFHLGTTGYRAPELTIQCSPYSKMVDIWSVACIIFEMRTRMHLFDTTMDEEEIMGTLTSDESDDADEEEEDDETEMQEDEEHEMTDDSDDEAETNVSDYAATRVFQRVCGRFPSSMVRNARYGRLLFNRKGFVRDCPPPVRRDSARDGIMEVLIDFETMKDEEKQALAESLAPLVKLSASLRSSGSSFHESPWCRYSA